ncbi:uncharacterized protein Dwil_GK18391 [Drosophila willistoni]|uniref:RPA-interacting protein C-terminal domain-containing protein n=1 Tax=Drosophila willistoni TaxID=7260 RepID=B4NLI9_DROWI|nr:uncharacterized protein Dwil_GK18391 [Drosophila willistoni]
MECPSSPVYQTSVEQKRQAQSAAKRRHLGMPKLREMLRDKCRIRIMDARKNNIDSNRTLQLAELKELLRLELIEFDHDLELEMHILQELLSDVNEWYALGEQSLETLYVEPDASATEQIVLCPVCQMKPLSKFKSSSYICECGIKFEHSADLKRLEQLLQKQITTHEMNCTQALCFFIEPSTNALYTMCGTCDYFSSV